MMGRETLENRSEEFEQLRSLLMGDELDVLKRIEIRLASLEFSVEDEEQIAQKVLSLFDTVLLQKLREKDSRTITLLSEHISQVITQSSEHHLPELSWALRRVISPAIAQEIEDNQDKMVDALYPIMGGMVSKYVSQSIKEMLDRINVKIEEGLSFGRYKRKLKSKVTGVSEVELLIEESTQASISSLLAIHKESGLLVAEAHLESREIGDAHMVASMASAVKDFINDWIQGHRGDASEIEILSYGNASLYIESAGSVYVVAFLDEEPDREQRIRINTFFAKLIKKYHRFFQGFDGDDTGKEVQEISAKMEHFLKQQVPKKSRVQPEQKRHFSRYLWIVFLLVGVGYLIHMLSEYYRVYRTEDLLLRKTGQKITIVRSDGAYRLIGNIASLKAHQSVMKIARWELPAPLIDATHLPLDKFEETVSDLAHTVHSSFQNNAQSLDKRMDRMDHWTQEQVRKHEEKYATWYAAMQKKVSQEHARLLARCDALTVSVDKQKTDVRSWQQLMQSQDANMSDAVLSILQNMQGIQDRMARLEKEMGLSQKTIRHYQEAGATIREIAQLETYLLKKLTRSFGEISGFDPRDGSFDFKNTWPFAPGKASVTPGARKWIDTYFQHYIRLLLEDEKVRPYLKNIVIEGYTNSVGNPKRNRTLSLQRAQVVRDYILRSSWAQRDKLEKLLIARGLGSTHLVLRKGIEDKDASRRIRVKFDLDTRKIIQAILKAAK
jgi:outer membrane protein OmpA-like peptidoglycan-associated protein